MFQGSVSETLLPCRASPNYWSQKPVKYYRFLWYWDLPFPWAWILWTVGQVVRPDIWKVCPKIHAGYIFSKDPDPIWLAGFSRFHCYGRTRQQFRLPHRYRLWLAPGFFHPNQGLIPIKIVIIYNKGHPIFLLSSRISRSIIMGSLSKGCLPVLFRLYLRSGSVIQCFGLMWLRVKWTPLLEQKHIAISLWQVHYSSWVHLSLLRRWEHW